MTIKEKAKAYDEAIERAREIKRTYPQDKVCETIFPELKEPEDETVRKALIEMVHDTTGDELWVDYNVHKEEALAWLEKQGEQKPTIEIKSAEESLGINSDTYNEIVDECIYSEQKSQRMISAEAKEAMYAKTAWNEEDEHRIKLLEALCEDKLFESVPNSTMYEEMKTTIDWLKSLRPQLKQEWSEKDEKIFNKIIRKLDESDNVNHYDYTDFEMWLIDLKERLINI